MSRKNIDKNILKFKLNFGNLEPPPCFKCKELKSFTMTYYGAMMIACKIYNKNTNLKKYNNCYDYTNFHNFYYNRHHWQRVRAYKNDLDEIQW